MNFSQDEVERELGRKEGIEEAIGEKIGTIHFCERLLNRPRTPREQLATLSLIDLARLIDDLQKQLPAPL